VARKYKPVVLPLRSVPDDLADERARCPMCERPHAGVIGRLGLRLVFRCEECRVRFYRPTASVQLL
jgi:hypothetical protein